MKSLVLTIFTSILLLSFSTPIQSQTMSTPDSIVFFYDQLFETLEANFLYTKDVDWQELKPFIKNKAMKAPSFEVSLEWCSTLFDTIKAEHTILFSGDNYYKGKNQKQLTAKDFNESFIKLIESNPPFEVKVLDDDYGYIFLPGMLLLNATKEEQNERTQLIYDAIMDVNDKHKLKGWILDVRYNTGGNANVQIAGLYHLLGNNTTYLFLDVDKNLKTWTGLVDGVFYHNQEVMIETKIRAKPDAEIPVALLTSVTTGSSGEDVALAFRGRKNVIVIGEETYGYTTSNDLFELPFGTTAAITLSYATDRSARYTRTVIPDIEIVQQDNFEDLIQDKNIIEAIKFIDRKQRDY